MTKTDNALEQMAHLVGEVTEVSIAGQAAGLRLLAAEMQALAQMMPGMAGPGLGPGLGAGLDHSPTYAEIEADFDNMPV